MEIIKREINTREDVELLVKTFYTEIRTDELLSPIFNQMIRSDEIWEHHFKKLSDFWESNLLGNLVYEGTPMEIHIWVDMQVNPRLNMDHLKRWLEIWHKNLDLRFTGIRAEFAHKRAEGIGLRILERVESARKKLG